VYCPAHTTNTQLPAGVVVIVASWFISPLMAGILSYLLYLVLRICVLRGEGSYKKAIFCLPVLLFITLFVNMFFILYKVG
jgi:sodium-dependent phosphate transporter